jgi:hypothetical protein
VIRPDLVSDLSSDFAVESGSQSIGGRLRFLADLAEPAVILRPFLLYAAALATAQA